MLIGGSDWQPQRLLMNKDRERNKLICNECNFLVDSDLQNIDVKDIIDENHRNSKSVLSKRYVRPYFIPYTK